MNIKDMLQQLNDLYYSANGGGGDMDLYYGTLEENRKHVQSQFPGLTIALTEPHEPDYPQYMTHALVPDVQK